MRIFFIGSVSFSRAILSTILEAKHAQVVGIATKSASSFNSDHSDLSDIALKQNIPYRYVRDINSAKNIQWISELEPDVVFCFGWSALIRKELLELPKLGVIGYHPAKLPHNRGRHPLIWALVLGLSETASTFFKMDEGADTGKILSQSIIQIQKDDNAQDLYEKMIETAVEQVKSFIPQLVTGQFNLEEQDHNSANYWRKRSRRDGEIDFRMTSEAIYNLVRALTRPYVGAHVVFNNEEVKVWSAVIGPKQQLNIEPGQVLETNNNRHILVKTQDGSLWLVEHELPDVPEPKSYFL